VNDSDFALAGKLRARRLRGRRPPTTTTVTEQVRLERHDLRDGLPERIEPGRTYVEVTLDKRLEGRID
jgi:hypothetical protein